MEEGQTTVRPGQSRVQGLARDDQPPDGVQSPLLGRADPAVALGDANGPACGVQAEERLVRTGDVTRHGLTSRGPGVRPRLPGPGSSGAAAVSVTPRPARF